MERYDFHTHFIPPDVMDWLKTHHLAVRAKWEERKTHANPFLSINDKWAFELKPAFVDEQIFFKEQEKAGVTCSVVSPIPQLFLYELNWGITKELAQVYNRSLAKWVQANPRRLMALATLPLNHPEEAALELNRAMGQGLKGAIIAPGVSQMMLTDEALTPFWEEANRLSAIIFIHPLLGQDPRLRRRMMPNLIGVPWETTLCATDLILSGHLDAYPRVKILLAHGGGFLPYQVGRLDKGYEMWPAVREKLKAPPSEYLRRLWFDSVVWEPKVLTLLVQLVGNDRIVPGSDFPFDLSAWPPLAVDNSGVKALLG